MTPMVEEAFRQVNPDNPEAAEKEYASRNPVKRLGTPAEVASVVSFLLSDDNGYLNGQVIAIDGGEVSGVKYIAYFFRMFYIQLHINLYICLVLYSFAYKTRESTEINAIAYNL